jgi:hypothetical protein
MKSRTTACNVSQHDLENFVGDSIPIISLSTGSRGARNGFIEPRPRMRISISELAS